MNRSMARWANVACLAALLSMTAAAASGKDAPAKGTKMKYRDGGGHEWCVTVVVIDLGADSRQWVWFSFEDEPRRIEHQPVEVLEEPCGKP